MVSEHLALRDHLAARLVASWPAFRERRQGRLAETARPGGGAERVAELIVADLFTTALDWHESDLNHQIGYADLLLTRLGVKYLVVETKRPGALAWNGAAVAGAVDQATGYALEQGVGAVAVSDGHLLYAADLVPGGHRGRVLLDLDAAQPPDALWWLSVHGIYRPVAPAPDPGSLLPKPAPRSASGAAAPQEQLDHRYGLPARCFAYVGHPGHPASWHLPYRHADGTVDAARLPKAIGAILTNYRGATVGAVPEAAIPSVLARLAEAAREVGHMPDQRPDTADVYRRLDAVLHQFQTEPT
jgi:hypothetical protein